MEVLNKAKENDKDVSLYFLDVGLNFDINGITLASKIREFDEKGFIVFVTTHGEMKDIEGTLDERFVRFHRAYLVNKDNISEIDKKNRIIHMINGEICYSSSKNLENFYTK